MEEKNIAAIFISRLGDPISPIFSLQINPLPDDLQIFAENPIMLVFDVVIYNKYITFLYTTCILGSKCHLLRAKHCPRRHSL